jgi:hypothetical protein
VLFQDIIVGTSKRCGPALVVKRLSKNIKKSCQKVVKSCQKVVKKYIKKVVKKLAKSWQKIGKSCQKIVKKCQKVVKNQSKMCQKNFPKLCPFAQIIRVEDEGEEEEDWWLLDYVAPGKNTTITIKKKHF